MIKNKKAQEEIVGFVLIVVIVAIITVILLGISIRSDNAKVDQESKDVYQFLESAMQLTTTCSISYEPDYSKLNELISICYLGTSKCLNGENPCSLSNKTISSLLSDSFLANQDSSIKGYEFRSAYSNNATSTEIIFIKKGACQGAIRGSEILIPADKGTISNSLKLCY